MSWIDAQKLEKEWWGACSNTFGEELKQTVYAKYMGLQFYDDGNSPLNIDKSGLKIIDIGGGPVSLLLKTKADIKVVVDPCGYPGWVRLRYIDAGILLEQKPAEDIPEDYEKFDEVWCYNCLQHVVDPEKIVYNMKRIGKVIRLFEWINHPINEAHPHELTAEKLDKWLNGKGTVVEINEKGCVGKCYYGEFNTGQSDGRSAVS